MWPKSQLKRSKLGLVNTVLSCVFHLQQTILYVAVATIRREEFSDLYRGGNFALFFLCIFFFIFWKSTFIFSLSFSSWPSIGDRTVHIFAWKANLRHVIFKANEKKAVFPLYAKWSVVSVIFEVDNLSALLNPWS